MKSIQDMSQGELGAYVQSHLRENGIDVVLSGGAVVSIYSSNKYISLDLDLVNIHSVKMSKLRESMMEIGFFEDRRYFKHPDTQYFVEFPQVHSQLVKNQLSELTTLSSLQGCSE